jgi:hypothetical protein
VPQRGLSLGYFDVDQSHRGGVVEDGGALTLDDSSIDHNTASAYGGGVFLLTPGGQVILNTNSVITQNTAAAGGGIYNDAGGTIGGDGTGSVTGNTPDDIVG